MDTTNPPPPARTAYERLIDPLRDVARRLGYTLAVHGSLRRDIDLVACPWARDAVSARTLVRAIQAKAREVVGCAEPCRSEARSSNPKYFRDGVCGFAPKVGRINAKPHGRRAWAFHLTPKQDGPYIDLSVMPRGDEVATLRARVAELELMLKGVEGARDMYFNIAAGGRN